MPRIRLRGRLPVPSPLPSPFLLTVLSMLAALSACESAAPSAGSSTATIDSADAATEQADAAPVPDPVAMGYPLVQPARRLPRITLPDAGIAGLTVRDRALSPGFSPDVHDYTVRCVAGDNPLELTVTPGPGSNLALLQPPLGPVDLGQPVTVVAHENDAVVLQARTAQGQTADYWLRCLPHDFPTWTIRDLAPVTPGYYLLGNTLLKGADAGYAMVLDSHGTPVWYHRTGLGACLVEPYAADSVAYSTLLGTSFGTNPTGSYTVADLATQATRAVQAVGMPTDHHELLPVAGGHSMVLAYPQVGPVDLTSRGVTVQTVADCQVQELDANGQLVWSWSALQHMDPATESTDLAIATVAGQPVVDAFHCNSLALTPEGDVLVSIRHFDAVVRVSRATGHILWKLGGIPNAKDGAPHLTLQDDPSSVTQQGGFFHQHDVRLLANGHLTMFDNHGTQPGVARGLELQLDVANGAAHVVWAFQGAFPSLAMGSMQTLADGGRLIGWGLRSGPGEALAWTEVDPQGQVARELVFDHGDSVYRVHKVEPGALKLDLLRQSAGK